MKKIFIMLLAMLVISMTVFAETRQDDAMKFTNTVNIHNKNAVTNAVNDRLTIKQETTGTPATGIGVGIALQVEDAGGLEEQGSVDIVGTTVTDAAEDFDWVFKQNSAGAISETLRIVAASSATVADYLKFTGNTTEANGIVDLLYLGTGQAVVSVAGMGAGVTFNFPDGTGTDNEEQGAIDVVSTDVTAASNESDMVFSIRGGGAATNGVNEVFRLVADAQGTTTADKAVFTSFSAETNGVVDVLELKSYGGTVTTSMGLGISIQQEDATSLEEKASIDFIQTDATQAGSDVDVVFSQNVAGTMTNMFSLDADGGTKVIGAQAGSAVLSIEADQSDDAADTWTFTVADAGALTIANESTATMTINEVVAFGSGNTNAVVLVTDAASYQVTAANSGKVHIIADLTQDTGILLPAEAAGLYYKFVYAAAATEAHDHTINSENNTNYFKGGVAFADLDAGAGADEIHAGVYSDGNSNSKLTVNNAATGTVVEIWCDGTNWYVTGMVVSDTVPAFADQ